MLLQVGVLHNWLFLVSKVLSIRFGFFCRLALFVSFRFWRQELTTLSTVFIYKQIEKLSYRQLCKSLIVWSRFLAKIYETCLFTKRFVVCVGNGESRRKPK